MITSKTNFKKSILCVLLAVITVLACSAQAFAADGAKSVYESYKIPTGSVRMVGHRGYSSVAPENTLPSYIAAGESSFWGVECDILRTLDGVWVLMHDDTVDRMTDGTGRVDQLTYAEIAEMTVDAGNNIDKYPGTKVPTLEEYLDVCKEYRMHPVIEIKKTVNPDTMSELAAILSAREEKEMFVIISFGREICIRIKELMPEILVYYLVDSNATFDDIDFAAANNLDGMDILHSLSEEYYTAVKNAGLDIITWTVNSLDAAERVYELGGTCITTDLLTQEKPQGDFSQRIRWWFRDLIYKISTTFKNMFKIR